MKAGDVVSLKAGSYLMVVSEVVGDNIHCVWFTESQRLCIGVFKKASLNCWIAKENV